MNILVTGARGFVGKNFVESLKNIKYNKDRTRPELKIDDVFEYDIDTDHDSLEQFCESADFIFDFAGVNRPKDSREFTSGNVGFTSELIGLLEKHGNACPIVFSSSVQAALAGRYANSEYGKSKLAAEKLLFDYANRIGARVLIYRFPNLFGKWCRPNYNSAVATFCNNIANGLPITVSDPDIELELLYIDDLVDEMLNIMSAKEHRCDFDGIDTVESDDGKFCTVPTTYHVTLGTIVKLLNLFDSQPDTLIIPDMPFESFEKKLYSTYLSYLPREKTISALKMNIDSRGSFTELLKTVNCGQFSVNISKPGITKGQHWHNSKWEIFIVVSGRALIQERCIGSDEILNFEVSGDNIEAVRMLPGYTHNIINLSDSEDLITLMWANEQFDPSHPDTFGEAVE